jgi:repressor LexA
MLTPSQKRLYDFIKVFIAEKGYAPTLTEMAEGIGLRAKSLMSRYVQELAAEGVIELEPGHRQIRLKTAPEATIPLIGKIAAGTPIEAFADEPIDVLSLLTKPYTHLFALQAQGDSMVEAGIFNGDYVLCEKRDYAHNGEIVVAIIDQKEATLKRFQTNKNGTITLVPANITLKQQSYGAERITIQGIFRGLLRLSR